MSTPPIRTPAPPSKESRLPRLSPHSWPSLSAWPWQAERQGVGDVDEIETFGLIFSSIVVEALPFILLGAVVSAAIAV